MDSPLENVIDIIQAFNAALASISLNMGRSQASAVFKIGLAHKWLLQTAGETSQQLSAELGFF